jgi:hypothetical protein
LRAQTVFLDLRRGRNELANRFALEKNGFNWDDTLAARGSAARKPNWLPKQ